MPRLRPHETEFDALQAQVDGKQDKLLFKTIEHTQTISGNARTYITGNLPSVSGYTPVNIVSCTCVHVGNISTSPFADVSAMKYWAHVNNWSSSAWNNEKFVLTVLYVPV